jgi:hypothetical protein
MVRRLKLNRLELVAIAAAVVTTWLCIGAALDAAELYRMGRPMPAAKQMLAVLGWLLATFGPLGLAVGFWRLAGRLRTRWPLHLLFLPCAFASLMIGDRIMLFAIGAWDFDDTIGGPVLQALLLFLIAVPLYFGAVLWTALASRRR